MQAYYIFSRLHVNQRIKYLSFLSPISTHDFLVMLFPTTTTISRMCISIHSELMRSALQLVEGCQNLSLTSIKLWTERRNRDNVQRMNLFDSEIDAFSCTWTISNNPPNFTPISWFLSFRNASPLLAYSFPRVLPISICQERFLPSNRLPHEGRKSSFLEGAIKNKPNDALSAIGRDVENTGK